MIDKLEIIMSVIKLLFRGKHFISIILLLPPFLMCNISTLMYHVIHDDHLEIKLIVLYCIVLYCIVLYCMACHGSAISNIRMLTECHVSRHFLGEG